MLLLSLLCVFAGIFIYQRYIPVNGVAELTEENIVHDHKLLDVRDFQSSFNHSIEDSLKIPFPYLKRYFKEIPKNNLIIIASDSLEKNLAIRFLLKRNFSISGFIILQNKKEGKQLWNTINKQKIV